MPRWLASFFPGNDTSLVYEVSYVTPPSAPSSPLAATSTLAHRSTPPAHPAPRTPSVTMISQNLTWADLLSVHETVTYTPSPSDPTNHTRFEQSARITSFAGGWQKIKDKIEGFTVERFGQNAEKGRVGFESVLEMSRRAFADERARERQRKELGGRGEGSKARL